MMINKLKGISFFEILIILVFFVLLFLFIMTHREVNPLQARRAKAEQDIALIVNALEAYKKDNGFYPTETQGLLALYQAPVIEPLPQNYAAGGYLAALPLDPWGRPYLYANPGVRNVGGVDVYTLGDEHLKFDEQHAIGNW